MFRRDDCTVRCATRCVCLRRSCISEHVFSWGARFVQKMRFDGNFQMPVSSFPNPLELRRAEKKTSTYSCSIWIVWNSCRLRGKKRILLPSHPSLGQTNSFPGDNLPQERSVDLVRYSLEAFRDELSRLFSVSLLSEPRKRRALSTAFPFVLHRCETDLHYQRQPGDHMTRLFILCKS